MDLQKFKRKAARKRGELEGFLKKLDETVPKGFSRIITEEDAQVWQETDCTTCANCCKTMTPVFTKADIKRYADNYLKEQDGIALYRSMASAEKDPERAQVFEKLAKRPQSVGELAGGLPVSRPAVSQHLAVLKAAGLVKDHAEGARRVYQIDPAGLGPLRAWLDQFWDRTLQAFKAEAESAQEDNE